jgi:hypothetical protein
MTKRIIFQNDEGGVSIIIPAQGSTLEQLLAVVPANTNYEIVDVTDILSDRTFRNAWFHDTSEEPQKIGVHLDRAKSIAHEHRREKRRIEMAPLDLEVTIPSKAKQAEEDRQKIRDKYATIQAAIDNAASADEIKIALGSME